MEIVILPTAHEVGEMGARIVAGVVRGKPTAVIGLATGSSPLGIYSSLEARVRRGELDFSRVRAFALDEYVGIPASHPESYHNVIDRTATRPLGMDPALVHVPDGMASDLAAACRHYEHLIDDAGGVDVQVLGIGANGHIGFNEPTSSLASRTRIKTLTPQTRQDNARFFGSLDEVPTHCLTQGLGTIMRARQVVLVAQGAAKTAAIAAAVEGPVSAMCPASVLQFHEHAMIIVDEDAAAGLKLVSYYKHSFANKPDWQRV